MTEIPLKRKRITSDILSIASANVIVSDHKNDKIKKIESLVNQLELENMTLESKLKCEAVSYNLELEEKAKTIAFLIDSKVECQKRAIYHKERYDEATATLAKMKEKHNSVANELRESLESYRSKVDELNSQLSEQSYETRRATMSENETKRHLTSKIRDLNMRIESLEEEVQEKADAVQRSLLREQELTEKINTLEQQLSNSSSYPSNPQAYQDLEIQYQSISKRTLDLETENIKLASDLKHHKSISQNIETLRQEKESLLHQLKRMDDICEENYRIEKENIKLKAERASWASYLESQPEFNTQSPDSIIYKLAQQAEEAKYFKQSIEYYKSQVMDQMKAIEKLEDHIDELKKTVVKNEHMHTAEQASRDILAQNSDSLKRHIAILEGQLALYDQEEMLAMDQDQYDETKAKRIQELEELLRESENRLSLQAQELAQEKIKSASVLPPVQVNNGPYEKLESGVSAAKQLSELVAKQDKLMQDLEAKSVNESLLQRKLKSAQEQIEQLTKSIKNQERLAQISIPATPTPPTMEQSSVSNDEKASPTVDPQAAESQTDSDESGLRILTLVDNPAAKDLAIRTSLLKRLEKENADLLNQIASVAASDTDLITVPKSSLTNLEAKNQDLQSALQSREKRIQRLHSIWEAKVNETSSQIRQLLGYNVIFRNDGVTRLESILVDPTELAFIVKIGDTHSESEKGMLRMVGTKKDHYIKQLEDIYRVYIIEDRNIPAFLSAAAQEFYVSAKQHEQSMMSQEEEHPDFMQDNDENSFEPYDEETRIYDDQMEGYDEEFTVQSEPNNAALTVESDNEEMIEHEEYTEDEEDNELIVSSEVVRDDSDIITHEYEEDEENLHDYDHSGDAENNLAMNISSQTIVFEDDDSDEEQEEGEGEGEEEEETYNSMNEGEEEEEAYNSMNEGEEGEETYENMDEGEEEDSEGEEEDEYSSQNSEQHSNPPTILIDDDDDDE
ncbi:coiled-coil domain-containing protein mad1 [Mucor circinelloides]